MHLLPEGAELTAMMLAMAVRCPLTPWLNWKVSVPDHCGPLSLGEIWGPARWPVAHACWAGAPTLNPTTLTLNETPHCSVPISIYSTFLSRDMEMDKVTQKGKCAEWQEPRGHVGWEWGCHMVDLTPADIQLQFLGGGQGCDPQPSGRDIDCIFQFALEKELHSHNFQIY